MPFPRSNSRRLPVKRPSIVFSGVMGLLWNWQTSPSSFGKRSACSWPIGRLGLATPLALAIYQVRSPALMRRLVWHRADGGPRIRLERRKHILSGQRNRAGLAWRHHFLREQRNRAGLAWHHHFLREQRDRTSLAWRNHIVSDRRRRAGLARRQRLLCERVLSGRPRRQHSIRHEAPTYTGAAGADNARN